MMQFGQGRILQSELHYWVPYHVDWDKNHATIRRVRKFVPEEAHLSPWKSRFIMTMQKKARILVQLHLSP